MPAPKVNSEKTPTIGDRYVNATEKLENSPRTRLSWGLYPRLASLASSSSVIAEVVGVASCIEVLLSFALRRWAHRELARRPRQVRFATDRNALAQKDMVL